MARHIAADGLELFRAVVTETRTREGEEPKSFTAFYGPYNNIGTAKSMVTREQREASYTNNRNAAYARRTGTAATVVTVSGRVEKANVSWEPVP